MNMREGFDPDVDISDKDMKLLASSIEEYLDLLTDVMVIPDDIKQKYGKDIKEGIKITKKLIQRLRKGDRSVFKSKEEWEDII